MLKFFITLFLLNFTLQFEPCSKAFGDCGAGQSFVWCEFIEAKSNTGEYSAFGGSEYGKTHGVSMHVTHHETGCNGTPAGQRNFFRGSKVENSNEYHQLEEKVLRHVKEGHCGKIDSTGFFVTPNSRNNTVTKELSDNDKLLYGDGRISYYIGEISFENGQKGCDNYKFIGSYDVFFKSDQERITVIRGENGQEVRRYVNHKKITQKKHRNLLDNVYQSVDIY